MIQITVQHKIIDGAHVFTSSDQYGRGLCSASLDEVVARDDVIHQLRILLRLNHGIEDPELTVVFEDTPP
jgi:hypothetical protein